MKIVRKNDSIAHKNAETCTAYEYTLGHPNINIANVEISGRYPIKGCAVNSECVEVVYVISGKAIAYVYGAEVHKLAEGDVIMIEKGEKYYWEGECSLCISCTPAWYPEQHENIA